MSAVERLTRIQSFLFAAVVDVLVFAYLLRGLRSFLVRFWSHAEAL